MSPLLEAFLELDCRARVLMQHAGSSRQKEAVRDCIAELRGHVLDIEARSSILDHPLDVAAFKEILRHQAANGIGWPDLVQAVNDVREERPA